jgi:hypothetical protein
MRKFGTTLAIMLACVGTARAEPVWRENATRLYRDYTLHLPWANSLGDWRDAADTPLGAKAFARGTVARASRGKPTTVTLDVTRFVQLYGADFRINSIGGFAQLGSHRSDSGKPELIVTKQGQTRTLTSVADTTMDATTALPTNDRPLLHTHYGVLIRFDQPADQGVERALLRLTALNSFGTAPTLLVFRPVVLSSPATITPGATFEPVRPVAVRVNVRAMALLKRGGSEPKTGPARVLLTLTGAQIKPRTNYHVAGNIMTAWIEGDKMAALSDMRRVPGAPTEAYATVILKLDRDWTAPGGKLPGLSNTGGINPLDTCIVHGLPAAPGGWGGRPANGCHWSARTQFLGIRDSSVGAGTYFYAMSPADVNGVTDWWSQALPKERWVAYVERVKLNDPGRANGEIGYWLVDRVTAPGGKRMQAASGIIWRDTDQPQSAINEMWINVYCGGRDCGAAPWPRSTISIARVTVTDALPDLGALQSELDRLNAAH